MAKKIRVKCFGKCGSCSLGRLHYHDSAHEDYRTFCEWLGNRLICAEMFKRNTRKLRGKTIIISIRKRNVK